MGKETIHIEVDGRSLTACSDQMLIEVTDANQIYVPRFCYHQKLSIAANCRMCLVEIDKSPKPLPACATPVSDGMKVSTRSKFARAAQKSVMEFLLINHPLDCPICDQGGECELQDLAMGYGNDVSRYQESKRAVQDKDIGPLIKTDMTRCIHCTRCVRFGEEIAGLRELGVTGRGEGMKIDTYIEKSMCSELSGNIIDICPVGALTSKPYRYCARSWELSEAKSIAAHDSVGSNLKVHLRDGQIKRVVPDHNEAINEVWISDRDRFSYLGLYSPERLQQPMIKRQGRWQEVDWQIAFKAAKDGLSEVLSTDGGEQLGALASASSTLEELFLFQKLCRSVGCFNIDHRLRQRDFSDQGSEPVFPALGLSISSIEDLQAVLLVGASVRTEQPMINHRLKKAADRGATIMTVSSFADEYNYPIAKTLQAHPNKLPIELAGILVAMIDLLPDVDIGDWHGLSKVVATKTHYAIAKRLVAARCGVIWLGSFSMAHPKRSQLRQLAMLIAQLSGLSFGYLSESANTSGAWIAGVVPHRGPILTPQTKTGLTAWELLSQPRRAYFLLGVEPELDSWDGRQALCAMQKAGFVLSLSAYQSPMLLDYSDVLLPIALPPETAGTLINNEGKAQRFEAVAKPPANSKPAWKVLRLLADKLNVAGCAYDDTSSLFAEFKPLLRNLPMTVDDYKGREISLDNLDMSVATGRLQRLAELPMYAIDPQTRHANALQQTDGTVDGAAHLNKASATALGIVKGERVWVQQIGRSLEMPIVLDERVPNGCVLVHAGQREHTLLGPWHGELMINRK